MPPCRQKSIGQSSHAEVEIRLRKVILIILVTGSEWKQLMENLNSMDCLGLVEKPWSYEDQRMVRELLEPSNDFNYTLHSTPECWTDNLWRKVYRFWEERKLEVDGCIDFTWDKALQSIFPGYLSGLQDSRDKDDGVNTGVQKDEAQAKRDAGINFRGQFGCNTSFNNC